VSVGLPGPDRRDGAPEVVEISRVSAGDVAIGEHGIQEAQETGVLPAIKPALGSDDAGDPVPALRRPFIPEPRHLGLVCRPRRALLAPQPLHLVVIPRVELAGQRRRWTCPGLIDSWFKVPPRSVPAVALELDD